MLISLWLAYHLPLHLIHIDLWVNGQNLGDLFAIGEFNVLGWLLIIAPLIVVAGYTVMEVRR